MDNMNNVSTTGHLDQVTKGPSDCNKCVGFPDGLQIVYPLQVEMLCYNGKPYLSVNPETNFAKIDPRRLEHAWKCIIGGNANNEKAGSTYFTSYGIIFNEINEAFIDSTDYTLSRSTGNNQIPVGSAGDCYSWHHCDLVKLGSFSLDLTNTEVYIDPNMKWKYSGWPAYMNIVSPTLTD